MKTCSKCGVDKDESEFRNGRNGCKKCEIEYRATIDYYKSDKYKEYRKKYRKSDKYKESDKHKEYQKEYRKTDKRKEYEIAYKFKRTNGFALPPELVEVKLIINKTKQLCKTLKS